MTTDGAVLRPPITAQQTPRDIHCRILYADQVTIDTWWDVSLRNPFWRLYRNDKDGASISTPTGLVALPAGELVLVPAWGRFQGVCHVPIGHFYVHFDPVGLRGEWDRGCLERPFVLPPDATRAAKIDGLRSRITDTAVWRLGMQALLLDCLAAVAEDLPEAARTRLDQHLASDDPLAAALGHIERNLAGRLSIEELARLCAVSPDHFARLFRARSGKTPSRYIQERRVAIAAERLISSEDDIAGISTATGFANRFHFTRVFTRLMGVPPATYRRTGRV